MLPISIILGKLSSFLIKKVTKRSASTWPGHLVIESNSSFIKEVLKKNPAIKIILVAGTNGKTTTAKAAHHILNEKGINVCRNEAGANLLNGFSSLLLNEVNLKGKIRREAIIFEVDENSLPLMLEKIPSINLTIVLLNLFRDQLDRYGEVNTTSEKWKVAVEKIGGKVQVIANADDPQIAFIAKGLKNVSYYSVLNSLKKEKDLSHAVDSTTCPICRHNLSYEKISYSHLGNYSCKNCGFKNPKSQVFNINTNLEGVFNIYNLSAAALVCLQVFHVSKNDSEKYLFHLKPAFGRQENIVVKEKNVKILLSKNPAGLNESLKIVSEKKYDTLLIVLNDRIPDGRDISWIWDVDFQILKKQKFNLIVSGDRTYDIANRLYYENLEAKPEENLQKAINEALKNTAKNKTLAILATYSAMLEARKIITGKSIL